jgi:hypothetical protein
MQPHFSKGSNDSYAFVFSCPGRHEAREMHPAAGTTGRNLETLLEILSHQLGQAVLTRESVTIANAWSNVEYLEYTNRSEATDTQIRSRSNIDRLASELQHVTEMIVFCGRKANVAFDELRNRESLTYPIKVALVDHLGVRGLLSIQQDTQGKPIIAAAEQRRLGRKLALKDIQKENTYQRLEVVAQRILDCATLIGREG